MKCGDIVLVTDLTSNEKYVDYIQSYFDGYCMTSKGICFNPSGFESKTNAQINQGETSRWKCEVIKNIEILHDITRLERKVITVKEMNAVELEELLNTGWNIVDKIISQAIGYFILERKVCILPINSGEILG